jgi:hypothetical protein
MKRTTVRRIALAAIAASAFTAGVAHAQGSHPNRIVVRWCPEDAVQWGVGDFDGTRWERYHCIARDDL